MKSVNVYIKDRIREDVEYDIMVVPNIPDDKLNNAVKSFHCEEFYQSIVAIYDSTKLRTAKEGLVFTGEKMIYKNQGNHWTFPYSKIEKLDYQSDITKGMFGKENFEQWLVITMDGEEYKLEKLDGLLPSQYFSFEHLSSFLQKIIDDFDDFKDLQKDVKSNKILVVILTIVIILACLFGIFIFLNIYFKWGIL